MKIYYREMLPLLVFETIMFGMLFLLMWYSPENHVSKNMAHLATLGWVGCTLYWFTIVKFKK